LHGPRGVLLRKAIALALLAAYTLTGIEAAIHTHADGLRRGPDHTITAHTCGDRELHRPLDGIQSCAICAAGARFLAVLPDLPLSGHRTCLLILPAPARSTEITRVDILSSGKRGPPAA
jgi:hypothetical protein